jgi:uncharacterized protein (TIGR00290 family)
MVMGPIEHGKVVAVNVAFLWSGGKDSALGLSKLLARDDVRVDRLVTNVDPGGAESSVHGIPVELLAAQARSIGLPLEVIEMPSADLDGYLDVMREAGSRMRDEGIEAIAFGDLDCSGGRTYREGLFGPQGIEVLEPLEGLTSREAVEAFLDSGHEAITVVVDADVLGQGDVGVPLDRAFVDRLPAGTDPCGEFGEYHSFVHDGPMFASPVEFTLLAPHRLERRIRTTEGTKTYAYWMSTLQPDRRIG